jgi:uncharacterized membrane protein YqjE
MALAIRRDGSISEQLSAVRNEAMSMRGEAAAIASDFQQLMKMEVELAQAEMQEARGHAMKGSIFGAMAAEYAMLMSVFLFLAIMFAIDTALPLWAAALITTGIAALVASIFALLARSEMSKFSPFPKRAMRAMQEDVKWARSQIKSNRI